MKAVVRFEAYRLNHKGPAVEIKLNGTELILWPRSDGPAYSMAPAFRLTALGHTFSIGRRNMWLAPELGGPDRRWEITHHKTPQPTPETLVLQDVLHRQMDAFLNTPEADEWVERFGDGYEVASEVQYDWDYTHGRPGRPLASYFSEEAGEA